MRADLVAHPLLVAGVAHPNLLVGVAGGVPRVVRAGPTHEPIGVEMDAEITYVPHFRQWCLRFRTLNFP